MDIKFRIWTVRIGELVMNYLLIYLLDLVNFKPPFQNLLPVEKTLQIAAVNSNGRTDMS